MEGFTIDFLIWTGQVTVEKAACKSFAFPCPMKFYPGLTQEETGRKIPIFPVAYVGSNTLAATQGDRPWAFLSQAASTPRSIVLGARHTLAVAKKLLRKSDLETAETENQTALSNSSL